MTRKVRLYAAILTLACARGEEARLYLQLGHTESVRSVAFSRDGLYVLTGAADNSARLWDAATGREIRRFVGHTEQLFSVAFSHDGRFILTGSFDKTARLWDVATGKEIRQFVGHTEDVRSVAFSPDDLWVLTGSNDHTARLWNMATGQEIRRFELTKGGVVSLAFSPDGRTLVAGGGARAVCVWEVATGREVSRFEGHSGIITSLAFSPDGRSVITASEDHTARLWDVASGQELRRFQSSAELSAAVFSFDGRNVVTAGYDQIAVLWDVATGREIRRFEGNLTFWFAVSLAFAPDGHTLLLGGADRVARLFDVATGRETRRFEGHSSQIWSAVFWPDGRSILAGDWSGMAQSWDLATGRETQRFKHPAIVQSVSVSPDGRAAISGARDGKVRLWNLDTGLKVREFAGGDKNWIVSAVYSRDGRFVAAGSQDGTARIWDVATGSEVRHVGDGRFSMTLPVQFSPDGHSVAVGDDSNIARLFDLESGREIQRFQGHSNWVESVSFTPDGRSVLTGSTDGTARIWDVGSGRETRRFNIPAHGAVNSATFSPDGLNVLTGSGNDAQLWDAKTGRQIRSMKGHEDLVTSVAFSPDGQFILTASFDTTIRLWDTATGKLLAIMVSIREGDWAVVDTDGRFDASNLDGGAPLHWIVDSDPTRPLPLEIFMRDYYTPRLLARILSGEALPPLRKIADIRNRVQPDVEIVKVEPEQDAPNRVAVSVRAATKTGVNNQVSGLQDLRLFRDGQIVTGGYLEGPLRDDTYVFKDVQLPLSEKKVAFTAYAFNSERVKSATVERDFEYAPTRPAKPKAYLVQIGVNHYQASGCDLRYAVNDAHRLRAELEQRLKTRGIEVEAAELVSTAQSSNATKGQILETLAAIAKRATPDDAFFLSFSGHGYTSPEGQFYVLPSDIHGSCADANEELLRNAISADELTDWLRPIDAGEMTFILDSCYSAKSVEANDFKPGPMGSRGLGQLAYDKRMRILAASQSDAAAMEDSRLEQGLLSYFLAEQGLKEGKADWRPPDKQITVGEWLAYAADQVPKFRTPQDEPGRGVWVMNAIRGSQVPAIFDFSKQDAFVIQK